MSEHTHAGARHRKHQDAARDLLKSIRAQHPEADRAMGIVLFIDHLYPLLAPVEERAELDALVLMPLREWIAANWIEPRKVSEEARAERAAAKAAMLAAIKVKGAKRDEEIATIALLEFEMPDGRKIGDLSGAECIGWGEKQGRFFRSLGEQLAPRAKVRNHFTELDLQAIARHHKLIGK